MNFITKNLGWILLLMFFIFMLFIISSNDPQKANFTSTGLLSTGETLSGGVDQNLDELMKLIDNEEIQDTDIKGEVVEVKEESINEKEDISHSNLEIDGEITDLENATGSIVSNEDGVENNIQEDKKGFFARLFGKNDTQEEKNTGEETLSGSEVIEAEVIVIQGDESEPSIEVISENNFNSNSNIIKTSANSIITKYVDEEINYPGTNLKTQMGKTYEIGVEMLKLNNKSFTQTLELMNRGDKVKQITDENSYGCFQVEVLLTGSQGYVCKKYLAEEDTTITTDVVVEEVENTTEVKNDTTGGKIVDNAIPKISTQIGSYYKIVIETPSFFDVILERFTLQKGDILKQTSNPDSKTGCVSMKVVGTATGEHDGETVSICSPDMVVSI